MKKLLTLFLFVFLSSCTSTTGLQPTNPDLVQMVDLSRYNHVVVRPFRNVSGKAIGNEASRRFSDLLIEELTTTGAYQSVGYQPKEGPGVIMVSADITELENGSAMKRLWVGIGVGNSYFIGNLYFHDLQTRQPLGYIKMEEHSWAAGGTYAAKQTLNYHIKSAAKKIAKELAARKQPPMPY